MSGRSRSYKQGLYRRLEEDGAAILYLQAALEDSQAAFLVALRNVVDARQTAFVAKESGLNREHLYRMLSAAGDPKLSSAMKVLQAVGYRFNVEALPQSVVDPNLYQWTGRSDPKTRTRGSEVYVKSIHLVPRQRKRLPADSLQLSASSSDEVNNTARLPEFGMAS